MTGVPGQDGGRDVKNVEQHDSTYSPPYVHASQKANADGTVFSLLSALAPKIPSERGGLVRSCLNFEPMSGKKLFAAPQRHRANVPIEGANNGASFAFVTLPNKYYVLRECVYVRATCIGEPETTAKKKKKKQSTVKPCDTPLINVALVHRNEI